MTAAIETFQNKDKDDPATAAAAVTPHDTNQLGYVTRGLWVGTGGDLKVTMRDGQDVTFVNVQGGTLLPLRVILVFASGTTADGIVAVW